MFAICLLLGNAAVFSFAQQEETTGNSSEYYDDQDEATVELEFDIGKLSKINVFKMAKFSERTLFFQILV